MANNKNDSNHPVISIPNTPRSVMRNRFFARALFLLCQVVEEEVDQDGVDLYVWLEFDDLATDLLDGPYAASYSKVSA